MVVMKKESGNQKKGSPMFLVFVFFLFGGLDRLPKTLQGSKVFSFSGDIVVF